MEESQDGEKRIILSIDPNPSSHNKMEPRDFFDAVRNNAATLEHILEKSENKELVNAIDEVCYKFLRVHVDQF